MLECHACIRRHVRIVFVDILNPSPLSLLYHRQRRPLILHRGTYSPDTHRSIQTDQRISQLKHESNSTSATLSPDHRRDRALEEELRWLGDPRKLAEHTLSLLQRNNEESLLKALQIVRASSKDVDCVVSWNHLVEYEMLKQRVKNAVKLYHEMKKRAIQPNAQTFTTLFQGFARNHKFPTAASQAIAIYDSMLRENSAVRPNIIHTNAVLKVCALSGNLDAIYDIAARLPEKGAGAPDNVTFTTILNALRYKVGRSLRTGAPPEVATMQRGAVEQGRRLWQDVMARWVKRDVVVDEDLVCAMGRLLLTGNNRRDADDVLSLAEFTMGIPRQIPPLGDPRRRLAEQPPPLRADPEDSIDGNDDLQSLMPPPAQPSSNTNTPQTHPLAPPSAPAAQHLARPSNNTLSLLLSATLQLSSTAQRYWGLLTSPTSTYNITPDNENYFEYLRLLRKRRSSRLATSLLEEIATGALPNCSLETKMCKIAMSCCVRDGKNPNAQAHAERITQLMLSRLESPDASTLLMHLQLVVYTPERDWRLILHTLQLIAPGLRNLRSLITFGDEDDVVSDKYRIQVQVKNLVAEMIHGYEIMLQLGREELSSAEKSKWKTEIYALRTYLGRDHLWSRNEARSKIKKRGNTGMETGGRGGEGEGAEGRSEEGRRSLAVGGKRDGRKGRAGEGGRAGGKRGERTGFLTEGGRERGSPRQNLDYYDVE